MLSQTTFPLLFAYHDIGLHDLSNSMAIDISEKNNTEIKEIIDDKSNKFITCISHNDRHYSLIDQYFSTILPVQILVEKNYELVLINWHEKLRFNLTKKSHMMKQPIKNWESSQKQIWQPFTNFTIERAVLHWIYKLSNKNYKEVKKIRGITHFFDFSSLYDSYENAKNEFKKFNIDYSIEQYNIWRESQKIIFKSWEEIKNNILSIENLKLDYQRGIAMALRGIKEQLDEQSCWENYKKNLK